MWDILWYKHTRGWNRTSFARSGPLRYGFFKVCMCEHMLLCLHTPDWWGREGTGPTGDQFPLAALKACSLLRTGGNNTPQLANFICCHFPSLCLSLSPPETQRSTAQASHSAPLHACEAEIGCSGLSKVSKLSLLLPQMFSLCLYFSSVMFWEWK